MKIKGYTLVNESKIKRAIEGQINKEGDFSGGVGEDASDEMKLAAYDRLAGLIKNKKGEKVKTGCFCDLRASKKASRPATNNSPANVVVVVIEEPEVILEFRVGREIVLIPEDKPLPINVRVAKAAEEQIKAKENRKDK